MTKKSILIVVSVCFFTLCSLEIILQVLTPSAYLKFNSSFEKCSDPVLRILALGESTTAPRTKNGVDVSWPGKLEQALNHKLNKCVAVYNFGIPGVETYQLINLLDTYGDFIRPNVIITMMGINDGEMAFKPADRWWSKIKLLRVFAWTKFKIESLVEREDFDESYRVKLDDSEFISMRAQILNNEETQHNIKKVISTSLLCYKAAMAQKKMEDFQCAFRGFESAYNESRGENTRLNRWLISRIVSTAHHSKDCSLVEAATKVVLNSKIELSIKELTKISRHASRCLATSNENISNFIKKNYGQMDFKNSPSTKTFQNYLKVASWAKKHGSLLINMSYPTQLPWTMQNFLTTEGKENYSFDSYTHIATTETQPHWRGCLIDNFSYFKAKNLDLSTVFLADKFHMNPIGHEWITENIINNLDRCGVSKILQQSN